jgi:hypothetical protein
MCTVLSSLSRILPLYQMLLSLQSTMLVSNSLFPFFNLQITDSGSYLGTSCRKCRGSLTADKPVEKMMTPGHQVVDRREDVDTETAADTNELMKQHELPVTFADALWHGIIEAVIYMPGELCFSLTLTQFALTILFSLPFLIMKPDTLCRLNIEPRHLEKNWPFVWSISGSKRAASRGEIRRHVGPPHHVRTAAGRLPLDISGCRCFQARVWHRLRSPLLFFDGSVDDVSP